MAGRIDLSRPRLGVDLLKNDFRRDEIEMAATRILVKGDIIGRPAPTNAATNQIIKVTKHVAFFNGAVCDWLQDVAHSCERRFPPIDKDERPLGGFVVGLACTLRITADQIEMGTRLQIGALDKWNL